ncbi:YggT family protein [Mesocricetibacter intestinalis]|uniref:YggT family protein n=1 Tax=Mesocricetibacter intestinalis TaxID=1521930 RepID=A0A4R6VA81_9PAST|nr:YggT family protein [Mesocricetibacter intestinalis]TDQ56844.1 YggT family protein [Mesocricetibacter intestinalis]
MNSLQFLVDSLILLYMLILMLRMWFQYCRVDFYNPLSQTLVKITNPVLNPLRKFIPTVKNLDLAVLFAVFLFGAIKLPLLAIAGGVWHSDLLHSWPTYLIIGVLGVVKTFGKMILYVIFIGAIMSWFRRGADPFSYLLYQLGEPVLAPLRRILPRTGMIDFSPMIVAFALFYANRVMYDLFPVLWALVS